MILPFICLAAVAIDGDTIRCAGRPEHVRIARIDAPEMPGHCRRGRACAPGDPFTAQAALAELLDHGPVLVTPVPASPRGGSPFDRWHRIVARVTVNGGDLGAIMLAAHHAIPWPHR